MIEIHTIQITKDVRFPLMPRRIARGFNENKTLFAEKRDDGWGWIPQGYYKDWPHIPADSAETLEVREFDSLQDFETKTWPHSGLP